MASFLGRFASFNDVRQLVRFAIVGSLTAGLYVALLWLMITPVGLATLPASVIAFVLAIAFNYALHKVWTFGNTEAHGRTGPRYGAMVLGGLVINSAVLHVGTDTLGLGLWGPQVVSIAAMAAYNYVILSLLVFGRKSELAEPGKLAGDTLRSNSGDVIDG